MSAEIESMEISRELHLGRLLGEGGMGEVFEGFEPGLGSHAAVKILREELLDDREVCERFNEEARIMAAIEHPGCIPIYGWGTDARNRPFYAMKQIAGKTLSDLLEERSEDTKSLVWRRRLLLIFQSACETVAYAHEQGFVHRDLKPDNIMIDDFGSAYVIDWGISKRLGVEDGTSSTSRTLDGAVMGSPGYMAPEQADGKTAKAGPEADVFALGVILYEILTGEAPFRGDTEREAMAHTINRNPENPRRKNFLLGRSITAVCMKALHKEPKRRFRTAAPLAADIRAFNEGRQVSVAKPHPVERMVIWIRREPVRASLILALGMTILTAGAVIGLQVGADYRLANKVQAYIAKSDRDIVELRTEIAALEGQLTTATPGEQDKLEKELEVLKARRLQRKVSALNALRHVHQLRFLRADPELEREGQRRLFEMLESAQEPKYALLLHAVIESLLEDIKEGSSAFRYSEEDIARLQEQKARTAKIAGLAP